MDKKGVVIAIIGIDGTGKTTQAELLRNWLEGQGNIVFDIPNVPAFADWVFDTISQRKGYSDAMELFPPTVVDFAVAIDKVRSFTLYTQKASEQGAIIVTQRYTYCKIASAIQSGVEHINLLKDIYSWVPKPDITFYMDMPVDMAVERIIKRGIDMETYSDLSNFKKCYESLDEYEEFIKIDASQSVEQVQECMRNHVVKFLKAVNYKNEY